MGLDTLVSLVCDYCVPDAAGFVTRCAGRVAPIDPYTGAVDFARIDVPLGWIVKQHNSYGPENLPYCVACPAHKEKLE